MSLLLTDDTPVPVLAKTKTRLGRLWTYVRDDRPFAGPAPPAAAFFYSPDRGGQHPQRHLAGWSGLMQADAYAGYAELYEMARKPAPIVELPCWSHARRKFYELATLRKAPIAIEAVRRIDALFAIEREINGLAPNARLAVRQDRSRPLVTELGAWLRAERAKLSSKNPIAKAIQYSLKRWTAMIASSMTDGSICPTMPPSAPCAASPWAGTTGPSPAPTAAASAPPLSTPSSKPASSMTSILAPGSPTSWHDCRIIPRPVLPTWCLAIGSGRTRQLSRPDIPWALTGCVRRTLGVPKHDRIGGDAHGTECRQFTRRQLPEHDIELPLYPGRAGESHLHRPPVLSLKPGRAGDHQRCCSLGHQFCASRTKNGAPPEWSPWKWLRKMKSMALRSIPPP
jgi:hypothetical protein